jgi:2-haloacid dehalogenase
MSRICVFDLDETLLDMSSLDGQFARSFATSDQVRGAWLAQLRQSAFVTTILGRYAPFRAVAEAALEMAAAREDVVLTREERHAILGQLQNLAPLADVRGALDRLRDAGIRLAILANAEEDLAKAQLAHTHLREFFDQVISADAARRLKPAPETYRLAAERLGVPIGEIRLVSAHAWDVAGALDAGATAAFVLRPGLPFDPLVDKPDIVGEGLTDVVEHIVAAGA